MKEFEDFHGKMRQVYARLVKLGYANAQVLDEKSDDVPVSFTEKGTQLCNDLRKIFDVPKRPFIDIPPEEMCALCMIMVSFEPD